jgi:fructokinase
MVKGNLMHGLIHPEMGHIFLPHDWQADPFSGVCPYHGDCLEGMAAGPAMEKRWGLRAENLPLDHPAWQREAHYLALGLVNLILPSAASSLGGVMQQQQLFPLIHVEAGAVNCCVNPSILEY